MFTTLHDSRGEYDAPAKFRMPSTKSIVGALESVCGLMFFAIAGFASAFCVPAWACGLQHLESTILMFDASLGFARVLCVLCGMHWQRGCRVRPPECRGYHHA